MNIKRNYLFFPDKEGTKAGGYKPDAKLRFRIRYNGGSVINFNVGYRVDLAKWVAEAQRCKAGTTHGKKGITAAEINNEIQRIEVLADNVFKTFEVEGRMPTPDEYRDAFNAANGKEVGTPIGRPTFFQVFDRFTREAGARNGWTRSTFQKFEAVRRHLYDYNPAFDLATLTEADLQGFIDYQMQAAGLRNTSVDKNVSLVRWFLRWASSKGLYTGTLHTTWRPRLKGTDGNQREVIYLTWEELLRLYNFPVPESKQHLACVRDVFCFQCFTSLRYSDVLKLRRSDVKDTYISVVTQKTTDGLRIELNDYSRAILNKYENCHLPDGKALPVLSNSKMNDCLKELGELAGIDEPQRVVYFRGNRRCEEVYPKWALLTTHCGRRTFVVTALRLGIPSEVIMKWTGHSDYKAMKPYVKIVDDLKEQEMRKFNMK